MKDYQVYLLVVPVNRNELKATGFKTPIHVTSLPINYKEIRSYHPDNVEKEKIVVSSSRLDWEKNPMFMMDIELKNFYLNTKIGKGIYNKC